MSDSTQPITAKAWHNKVSMQVNMPGLGIIIMDRSAAQARRLATELNQAAAAAEAATVAMNGQGATLDAQATQAGQQVIDQQAARLFGSGPAEKRARAASQKGSALLALVDLFAVVGIVAGTLGFVLRTIAIA